MAYKKYRFVGLDKDVWLPDDIEVIVDIVPATRRNIRSNQKFSGQDRVLYHQTGNTSPGANARSERNYLHSGAGGRSVGYNFAVDDTRIIQLTPLDEVTWSAGNAAWNRRAWGIEQCVGKGLNLAQAERNAAALHGGLAAAKGWNPRVSSVMHQVVYGKRCPETIIRTGTWPNVLNQIAEFSTLSTSAAQGVPAPKPDVDSWPYPDPVKPAFWDALQKAPYVQDGDTMWYQAENLYRVTRGTKRQQRAVANDEIVGPDIQPGTEFRSFAVGQSIVDRKAWVLTESLTRVDMDALEYVPQEDEAA